MAVLFFYINLSFNSHLHTQIAITLKDWLLMLKLPFVQSWQILNQIAVGYVFRKVDLNNGI